MDTRHEGKGKSEEQRTLDNAELVEVFDTQQEWEALVVKGLLESAGIENVITALDAPQDVLPVGGVILRVMPADAEQARRIIEEYRAHPAVDSDVNDDSAA